MGGKGDSYDNALAETINRLYKAKLIHRRAPWKTKESLERATLEWVSWFNHHRLLEPIGYIPPAETEEITIGNSAVKLQLQLDLNQLASMKPGDSLGAGSHPLRSSTFKCFSNPLDFAKS